MSPKPKVAVWLAAVVLSACAGPSAPTPAAGQEAPAPASAAEEPAPVPVELFQAVERAPDDPEARRQLAIALHDAHRRNEALEHFEKLAELSPTRRHLLDLALAYGSVTRIPEAIATYERILAGEPEDPVALHNLGNIALRRGDNDAAIDYYQRAIAADPDYLLAHYHLGEALERTERFEEAYRSYERALEMNPKDGQDLTAADDALYRLGSLDLAMGAYERAAAFLAQVIQSNPAHPRAHHAYGQALMQLGRREEAQLQFDEHMRLLATQEPSGPVATGD